MNQSKNNTVKLGSDNCNRKTNRDGGVDLVYSVLLKPIYNFLIKTVTLYNKWTSFNAQLL